MLKPTTLKDVSGQIEQITSRLDGLEEKQAIAARKAKCSHPYVTVEIEKKDGWICDSAKCIFCDKVFPRKGGGEWLGKKAMRKIRKIYNSFK